MSTSGVGDESGRVSPPILKETPDYREHCALSVLPSLVMLVCVGARRVPTPPDTCVFEWPTEESMGRGMMINANGDKFPDMQVQSFFGCLDETR
eukprot:6197605-Pleurochrysis_carterae.AAC.3